MARIRSGVLVGWDIAACFWVIKKMLGHLLCTGDGVLLGETSWPVLTRSVCYFCLLPECREED